MAQRRAVVHTVARHATTLPLAWRAITIRSFCSGVTRANTTVSDAVWNQVIVTVGRDRCGESLGLFAIMAVLGAQIEPLSDGGG
jgi:hypothetical protein